MKKLIVTIDGPSGCGKGTLAQKIAKKLHWHYLDSGALYRALAWAALHHHLDMQASPESIQKKIAALKIEFVFPKGYSNYQLFCENENITDAMRTEQCGNLASEISALPYVRDALMEKQRHFPSDPALITDGRDMGTVIFPNADLKIFLTARLEERARRRFNQLKAQGIDVSLAAVQNDLAARDQRDTTRTVAPLRPAENAWILDSTHLNAEEVFQLCLEKISQIFQLR